MSAISFPSTSCVSYVVLWYFSKVVLTSGYQQYWPIPTLVIPNLIFISQRPLGPVREIIKCPLSVRACVHSSRFVCVKKNLLGWKTWLDSDWVIIGISLNLFSQRNVPSSLYPTVLKGYQSIVLTYGVRMGGRSYVLSHKKSCGIVIITIYCWNKEKHVVSPLKTL